MPGAITRRTRSSKVVPADSKRGASIISNFARVTKASATRTDLLHKIEAVTIKNTGSTAPVESSKKRKAAAEEDENDCVGKKSQSESLASVPRHTSKRSCRRQLSTIQGNQQSPATSSDISTRLEDSDLFGAQPLLERLNLQSPRSARIRTAPVIPALASQIPRELADLVALHASFTKTLALHIAHNGSSSPIDINAISPSITQSWGKRKVALVDIRRCIGVLASGKKDAPFNLVDYGRGKICVELASRSSAILNEPMLNGAFEKNLRSLWSKEPSQNDPVRFIAGLPKARVTPSESLAKAAPILNKGQRTLEELKFGLVVKKQEQAERKVQDTGLVNPDGTKMSLIDRIRYKELLLSQEKVAVPSAEELQRRAALQRVGDIAAVISMLSTATGMGQKRMAFSMVALLSKLKDSLRVPISREEGAACVKLLAAEVAPQWMKVVTIGGRENVVVLTDFAPTKAAIQDRALALSG